MTALSAGMTREEAAELLAAHNKDPFHIEHGETRRADHALLRPRVRPGK